MCNIHAGSLVSGACRAGQSLGSLTALQTLRLSGCSRIKAQSLLALSRLTALHRLLCNGCVGGRSHVLCVLATPLGSLERLNLGGWRMVC